MYLVTLIQDKTYLVPTLEPENMLSCRFRLQIWYRTNNIKTTKTDQHIRSMYPLFQY